MEVAVELVEGASPPKEPSAIAELLFSKLAAINGDFANALYRTAPLDNRPQLTLHAYGTGPFAGGQRKLKNEYVVSDIKYDKL
jgi:phenylacetate-CoA ligase